MTILFVDSEVVLMRGNTLADSCGMSCLSKVAVEPAFTAWVYSDMSSARRRRGGVEGEEEGVARRRFCEEMVVRGHGPFEKIR